MTINDLILRTLVLIESVKPADRGLLIESLTELINQKTADTVYLTEDFIIMLEQYLIGEYSRTEVEVQKRMVVQTGDTLASKYDYSKAGFSNDIFKRSLDFSVNNSYFFSPKQRKI